MIVGDEPDERQNPLLMLDNLIPLFKMLDGTTLKTSRFVCRVWNEAFFSAVAKSRETSVSSDLLAIWEQRNEEMDSKLFTRLSMQSDHLRNFLLQPALTVKLKELNVSFKANEQDIVHSFVEAVNGGQLSQLEILHVKFFNSIVLSGGANFLPNALPCLKTLHAYNSEMDYIRWQPNPFIQSLVDSAQNLVNLRILEPYNLWNLKKLKFLELIGFHDSLICPFVNTQIVFDTLCSMLEDVSETLRSLSLLSFCFAGGRRFPVLVNVKELKFSSPSSTHLDIDLPESFPCLEKLVLEGCSTLSNPTIFSYIESEPGSLKVVETEIFSSTPEGSENVLLPELTVFPANCQVIINLSCFDEPDYTLQSSWKRIFQSVASLPCKDLIIKMQFPVSYPFFVSVMSDVNLEEEREEDGTRIEFQFDFGTKEATT